MKLSMFVLWLGLFALGDLVFSSMEARDLRWSEVQDLWVQRSDQVRAARAQLAQSQWEAAAIITEWMPSLSVQHQGFQNEPAGVWSRQTSLTMSATLPNPGLYSLKSDQRSLATELAQLHLTEISDNQRHEGRLMYLRAKAAEQRLQNASMMLTLTSRLSTRAEQRYQRGFIQKSEWQRLELQHQRFEQSHAAATADHRKQLDLLSSRLGVSLDPQTRLASSMTVQLGQIRRSSLESRLKSSGDSAQVRRLRISADIARADVDSFAYKYLPDLSLGASSQSEFGGEQSTWNIGFTLSWTLVDKGTRFFQRRVDGERYAAAKAGLDDAVREVEIRRRAMWHDLERMLVSFEKQQQIARISSEVVVSSEKNFQSGNVRSKEVSDDIASYISELDRVSELSVEIAEQISKVALELQDNALFAANFPN